MDMSQASDLARRFCSLYSMSELGLSSFGGAEPSPDRKAAIDVEVEKILRQSYVRVVGLIQSHRSELDRLASALLEHETLTADECREVVEGRAIPSLSEKAKAAERKTRREVAERELRDKALRAAAPAPAGRSAAARGGRAGGPGGGGGSGGSSGGRDRDGGSGEKSDANHGSSGGSGGGGMWARLVTWGTGGGDDDDDDGDDDEVVEEVKPSARARRQHS
jgi:hypothetical protein